MSIEVRGIRKTFGNFVALDNVSLDFPTGQLVALIGPSGCGKTTLLRIIAGLDYASEGNIILDGEDASGKHVRERQVGFVFQHYALFRHMTVFDNVAFGLRVKPRHLRLPERQIKSNVKELLELVQLDWLGDRYPSQLSGGQRQRLGIMRALMLDPSVILLDEPMGALDPLVRYDLQEDLRGIFQSLKKTVVLVTHDMGEAGFFGDTVVLLGGGEIVQQGTLDEMIRFPASDYVTRFINAQRLPGVEAKEVGAS
jgi:sulfate transport system ATP-binding protein